MPCNQPARMLGVAEGMPLAEATSLCKNLTRKQHSVEAASLRESSGWNFEEYAPDEDHEQLVELAIWCEQFSPIVGVEEAKHPSCLLLDITGLVSLFESEANLVEQVEQGFRQRGYVVRMGAASTVGAAWAMAHFADASGVGEEAELAVQLGPLPVEALRIAPDTVTTLRQLGVQTIAQLMQLPRHGLATRLGEQLIDRIDQVFGDRSEVIVAQRPLPQFASEWRLEHPTDRRYIIDEILLQLTQQVSGTLAKHDHAAVQAEATLTSKAATKVLPISLFQPSSNPSHLYELFQLSLEKVQMREPIHCVGVTATTTIRIKGDQRTLWEEAEQNDRREVAMLVDRLSSRLGGENVFSVRAQAGALPERAYRKKPLAKRPRKISDPSAAQILEAHEFQRRPLWLYSVPHPIRVTAGNKRSSGPPQLFEFQNLRYEVLHCWGPERIEAGWWRGRSVRRDYYRVETANGDRFWLFRSLRDNAWFLHGCFD